MPEPGFIETLKNGAQAVGDAVGTVFNKLEAVAGTETREQGIARRKDQTDFSYTHLIYPSDLSPTSRNPYWITFYINKQLLSSFNNGSSEGAFAKLANGRKGSPIQSTAQINANQSRNLQRNFKGSNVGFGRKTQRTKMAIRLFMPDGLSWSYSNGYKDASISGINGMGIASSLSTIAPLYRSSAEAAKKGGIEGVMASLQSNELKAAAGPAFEVFGDATGQGSEFGAAFLGLAVNPQVDVIYISPELRQFTFDFLFAPQTARDAGVVQEIIKQFKFHSAPEMFGGKEGTGIGIGRYYVPPAEFDIEFSVNTMGRISTCVLQNITLDYAPSGTAFYVDGKPVNIRMTLQFKELEFITKALVEKGF